VEVARAAQALAPRVAPSFLVGFFKIDPPEANLKYSIFNRKYSII
jgi:hypothetical protein